MIQRAISTPHDYKIAPLKWLEDSMHALNLNFLQNRLNLTFYDLMNIDDFAKSPSAALRFIPALLNDDFAKSPSAALRFIPALLNSRYARRQSRFNRVNHCDVR